MTRSGGRPGSPVSDMQPESAMISMSEAPNLLYGPLWPKGVIEVQTSRGFFWLRFA